jgi:hypothetical protein
MKCASADTAKIRLTLEVGPFDLGPLVPLADIRLTICEHISFICGKELVFGPAPFAHYRG